MSRFRRLLRWTLLAFVSLALLGALAVGTIYMVASSRLPDVQSLRNVELQEPLYVYARDGRLMALFGDLVVLPSLLLVDARRQAAAGC